MYKDIMSLIESKHNIIFYEKGEDISASLIIQLILSNYSIRNLSIIDTTLKINFIKRNFKIDSTVNLYGYNSDNDILQFINHSKFKKTPYVVIQHKPKVLYPELFSYEIHVYDKEKYRIKDHLNRQTYMQV